MPEETKKSEVLFAPVDVEGLMTPGQQIGLMRIAIQDGWPKEPRGTWHPGDYLNKCRCGVYFCGRKHSTMCWPCAEKYDRSQPIENTTKGERMNKETEALIGRCRAELEIEGVLDEARALKLLDAIERLKLANGVLDSAAKDAVRWAQERDEALAELATAKDALVESLEARRVTEAEGGALQQMSSEIDRLRAELAALRDLFAACGETIHACSGGQPVTLAAINDAWAGVCAAQVTRRDAPSAPGEGEVAVSQAYLDALENAANQFCGSCRDKPTCTMSAKVTGTGCGAWRLDATRINALRARAAGGT